MLERSRGPFFPRHLEPEDSKTTDKERVPPSFMPGPDFAILSKGPMRLP